VIRSVKSKFFREGSAALLPPILQDDDFDHRDFVGFGSRAATRGCPSHPDVKPI